MEGNVKCNVAFCLELILVSVVTVLVKLVLFQFCGLNLAKIFLTVRNIAVGLNIPYSYFTEFLRRYSLISCISYCRAMLVGVVLEYGCYVNFIHTLD